MCKQKTAYEVQTSDWSSDVSLPISHRSFVGSRSRHASLGWLSSSAARWVRVRVRIDRKSVV